MNNFDQVVMGSLDVAQTEALKNRNTELTEFHLLFGLIMNPVAWSHKALESEKSWLQQELRNLPVASYQINFKDIKPNSKFTEWLTLASAAAVEKGKTEVGEKDLLAVVTKIFPKIKLPKDVYEGGDQQDPPSFITNLNELAEQGKLDPVIGRTKEIRSVIEILGRRNKNNPVLVGPAGVGKTAIIEGLADQIIKGRVPDILKGKTVYTLDMGSLMAGTKFRGEFEERLQGLLKFIKDKAGDALLFIDEIHQLVGAGRTDGAMDAANLMKPALARGDLHCIGATTPEEFQKYIMEDAALERRFRPVQVDEPSHEDAIEIMMGIRDKHEMHHGIKISDEALYSAVKLSARYLPNKQLPDKAIDLVDEAASALKLSAEAMPAELQQLEADIKSKRILAKVEDSNTELLIEAEKMQKKFDEGKSLWEENIVSLRKLSSVKNSLDRAKFELESAERSGKFDEASRLKYGAIPELEKQLTSLQHNWVLTADNIATVIARQTGIPVEKILRSKQENLLRLEEYLNSKIFGQQEALHELSQTLCTSYAGLSDESRPLGSFLMKGPTGVGKTETCKALAGFLFDNPESIIRIDMSEFAEKHAVAKLIGAPAGYVGYDEGGVLTEAVRKKPYAIVLFDEIEKAHPDFADILLQILDDGRLTDNKGRTVDFKNTILAMTTNSKNLQLDFKPEVLGRIDAVLDYKELEKSVVSQLVEDQLNSLNQRLQSKKVTVSLSDDLIAKLQEQGYDPRYGARPLRAAFNRLVNRPLAQSLLKGELNPGNHKLCWQDNKVIMEN